MNNAEFRTTFLALTLSLLAMGTFVVPAIAQSQLTTINFDDGVEGSQIIPVGTAPFYHYKNQVVYGTPLVEDLSSVYPESLRVRVYPTSQWNGQDITVFRNQSTARLDVWVGDPFADGTRVTYNMATERGADLMRENPVDGYIFSPYRVFVVGDHLIAYCAVQDDVLFRWARVAIISAPIEEVLSGTESPWEVRFITGEYSPAANNCGGIWAITDPVFYEGAYWTIATDYDSGTKTGGQCWITKYDAMGLPVGMVRLHTRAGQSNEHWHSGTIIKQDDHYKAVWHVGDGVKRLFYRQIGSLLNFEKNATVDAGSGVNGLYQTKDASLLDWGAVSVAAGPREDEVAGNSGWQNCFVLGQDPNDESKFLYGADVSAGLIQRVSIDPTGTANCEPLFNPVSRNVRQQLGENTFQLNVFLLARNGQNLVASVASQLDDGGRVNEFSGIILSEDGGQSWGWVWRGSPEIGVVMSEGITILSNGRIIVGTLNAKHSVQSITPGTKLAGKPLFVGYRPENLLTSANQQEILDPGGDITHGPVVTKTAPELPLPSIVHDACVFSIDANEEGTPSATLRLLASGIDQELLVSGDETANMNVGYWIRRSTPVSGIAAERMQVETRFGWTTPGASYGVFPVRYSPTPKVVSNDWVRMLSMYDADHLTGTFTQNPGDLIAKITGANGQVSLGSNDILFEYVNIGHDRPALPYQSIDASGVSSAKFTELGLGDSWTILVVMQIPEETWDSWSGNESDTWDTPVPVLTISDQNDEHFTTLEAHLARTATGGGGVPFVSPDFAWLLSDSESTEPVQIADYPLRMTNLIVAISKDQSSKLLYAVATPAGQTSGSRILNKPIDASTLRFSDITETDALEMYIYQIQADCRALTLDQLEALTHTLSFPQPDGPGCGCIADFNDDGVLNFFDVSLYLQAFTDQDPIADMNADGIFDFFDVSLFIDSYTNACG